MNFKCSFQFLQLTVVLTYLLCTKSVRYMLIKSLKLKRKGKWSLCEGKWKRWINWTGEWEWDTTDVSQLWFISSRETEDKIRGCIKASVPLSVETSCARNSILQKNKRDWCLWLEDEDQKGMFVCRAAVQENATWLYNHYRECRGEKKWSFHARKGCERVKK